MADVALKLSKKKLVEGLSDLSFKEIKEIMDSLIQKKLFKPPKAGTSKPRKSSKTKNFLKLLQKSRLSGQEQKSSY